MGAGGGFGFEDVSGATFLEDFEVGFLGCWARRRAGGRGGGGCGGDFALVNYFQLLSPIGDFIVKGGEFFVEEVRELLAFFNYLAAVLNDFSIPSV